jgi:hypothetical protein
MTEQQKENAPAQTEAQGVESTHQLKAAQSQQQSAVSKALVPERPVTRSKYYGVDKDGREFHREKGPFYTLSESVARQSILDRWARGQEIPERLREQAEVWRAAFGKSDWEEFVAERRVEVAKRACEYLRGRIRKFVTSNPGGLGIVDFNFTLDT